MLTRTAAPAAPAAPAVSAAPWAMALACALVAPGCAHYSLPANPLESPETLGPDRVARLELVGIQSGTDLVAGAERQSTDPETGKTPDPALQFSPINYVFGATVALQPDLEVGVRFAPYSPLLARAKYQFYGDPESVAKAGNWSAAVLGSGGLLLGSYSGESVTFYSAQAALAGGYRFAAHHLVSLAPFFNLAGLSGVGSASGSGSRYGAGLGYQYDIESLVVRLELTWASGTFTREGAASDAGSFVVGGPASLGGIFPGAQVGFRL